MEKTSSQYIDSSKTEPEVSILMLTYNRATFIKEAIQSVVSQNYTNWKLFVIDDGSTDQTGDIVQKFNDTRINYIGHKENMGLFERRKESLSYISGKYTAVLDSDDYWLSPKKLSTQVSWMDKNSDHVLIGTFTKLINEIGQEIGVDDFEKSNDEIRKNILLRNQFTHSSVLIRSNSLNKTQGYLPTLAEDLDLFLQLGEYGKMANIPEILTAYRVHKNSANDHGIMMARAVHQIILRRGNSYPRKQIALLKSNLRIAHGLIRHLLKKFFNSKI